MSNTRKGSLVTALLAGLLLLASCKSAPPAGSVQRFSMNWNGQNRIELPLTRERSGYLSVRAQLNGDDVVVVIDSGASMAVLEPSQAGAITSHSGDLVPVNGNKKPAARGLQLQLGTAALKFDAAIAEFPGDFPLVIGAPLFLSAVVEMDFEAGILTLHRPEAFVAPPDKPLQVKRLEILPTIEVRINGHEESICAIVDTGANIGMALTAEVVSRYALPEVQGKKVVVYGADGLRMEANGLAPLDELRVGGQSHRQVVVAPMYPGIGSGCGALGMQVLSRYRLVFDLRHDRIWFLPRLGLQ